MKKFIQGRWFPLLVAIAIVGIISVVLICLGFKITYAPEMENNWEAVSAVASLVGAVGAIVTMYFSIFALGKEIKLSQQQQKQNVALNLYPKRRDALRLFSEKKYDDVFWDATILFSSEVVKKLTLLGLYEQQYNNYRFLIDQYQHEMKNTDPDLYEQFQLLLSQTDIAGKHDELLKLCDRFKPLVDNPVDGEKILLDYRKLEESSEKARSATQALHLEIFLLMKDEITKSIQ